MRRLFAFAIALIAVFAGSLPASTVAAQSPTTWSLTASTLLCDDNPMLVGQAANCEPGEGIGIEVRTAGGDLLGTCTTERIDTPWGGQIAYCPVPDVPLNITLEISQDPASIPTGYAALNDPQTLVVGSLIPGGGDQTTVTFINIRTGTPDPGTARLPAVIHTGSCENLGGIAWELAPVTAESGPSVGQDSAIRPHTSAGTVAESLDTLIDEEHAVVVYSSDGAGAEVMLCGDIGGVDNDDGQLFIGLASMNGTPVAGVARLAYTDDPSVTSVAIYVVPAAS